MYLFHLKYFLEISKTGSFNKAAQNLHLTQPALSQAIHSLESYLGFSLFIRSKNGVVLTKEGENILADAEKIILTIENWKTTHTADTNHTEVVHIAALPLMITALHPLFSQLRENYPDIVYEVQETSRYNITKLLASSQASIGLFTDMPQNLEKHMTPLRNMNYIADPVFDDRYVVYCNKNNPFLTDCYTKDGSNLSFAYYENVSVHMYGLMDAIEQLFPHIVKENNYPYIINDVTMMQTVSQNPNLIGVIAESKLKNNRTFEAYDFAIIAKDKYFIPIQHYCVHRFDRFLSYGERVLLTNLKDYYKKY